MNALVALAVGAAADDGGARARPWLVEALRHTFESVVDAYAWGFGDDHARMVVGTLALALLVLVTAMTAFCAFREVGAIGMKLIKLLMTLGVALFLGSLVVPVYEFVFPDEAARAEAVAAATHAREAASAWTLHALWQRLV